MVVVDLNEEGARTVVDQVTADGGRAVAVAADATDPDRLRAAVETAVSRFGALHPAFNNARISGPLTEIDIGGCQRPMDINLNAVL